MRVIVIGAGIGGLVTAMALHERGIEVQVYESVAEIRPLGVGINVLPHAMAVLDGLGLMDGLLPLGVPTSELCFFNRHGQLIWREPRGIGAGYAVPQLSVHRGRLQLALLEAARSRLGDDRIRCGAALVSFDVGSHGMLPTVVIDDRVGGGSFSDTADAVVAADGIHSTVRRACFPEEGRPRWSGNVLWRATTVVDRPFLTGRSMFMAGYRPHKFVAYPITEPDSDGRQVVNWIAELDRRDAGLPGREDWNKRVHRSVFAARFSEWRFPWLDIPALIDGAQEIFEFPMVDRDPLPHWTHGRVTLLGDAAHPMYPIGSNGASQAILDARSLADRLAGTVDAEDALRAYDELRRPATARIVLSNREHGPEKVLDLAEERAPDGFGDVASVFAPGELEAISAQYKQVAGFSVAKP
jgi:2-polyprenyl-6-methoxyphenol hydroxylase-like FAD-dependent oxidoreductase